MKLLEKRWRAFRESYAGLSDSQLTEAGVTGKWSVKDIIAHVTWWEEEALKHLPLIIKGGRPQRYSVKYGGIDAFNALTTEQKRDLSLAEVLKQQDELTAGSSPMSRACPQSNPPGRRASGVGYGWIPIAITRSTPRQYGNGGSGPPGRKFRIDVPSRHRSEFKGA